MGIRNFNKITEKYVALCYRKTFAEKLLLNCNKPLYAKFIVYIPPWCSNKLQKISVNEASLLDTLHYDKLLLMLDSMKHLPVTGSPTTCKTEFQLLIDVTAIVELINVPTLE